MSLSLHHISPRSNTLVLFSPLTPQLPNPCCLSSPVICQFCLSQYLHKWCHHYILCLFVLTPDRRSSFLPSAVLYCLLSLIAFINYRRCSSAVSCHPAFLSLSSEIIFTFCLMFFSPGNHFSPAPSSWSASFHPIHTITDQIEPDASSPLANRSTLHSAHQFCTFAPPFRASNVTFFLWMEKFIQCW